MSKPETREELLSLGYNAMLLRYEWAVKRLRILARDRGQCRLCAHHVGIEVHHNKYWRRTADRKFLRLPWEYPDWMLLSLCRACHQKTGEGDTEAYKREVHAIAENIEICKDPTQYDVSGDITVFEHLLSCRACAKAVYLAAGDYEHQKEIGEIKTSRWWGRQWNGKYIECDSEKGIVTKLQQAARDQIEGCWTVGDDDWQRELIEWLGEVQSTVEDFERERAENFLRRLDEDEDGR